MRENFSFEEFKMARTDIFISARCKDCLKNFKVIKYDPDAFVSVEDKRNFNVRILIEICPYCNSTRVCRKREKRDESDIDYLRRLIG